MWLFAHGRVHTSQLRATRGVADSADCPFGCHQEEDLMHLLRDCSNARERWISIVKPELWEKFSSLSDTEWLLWNLNHKAGRDFTKKVRWDTLFGYVCWDIWVSRCRKLFDEDDEISCQNALSSLFRASWDQDLVSQCQFYGHLLRQPEVGHLLVPGFISLEVDGSVLDTGQSACGGVIKSEEGHWICGFKCKLTPVPPTVAEVVAIVQGLHICWNNDYRKVLIFTDCIEAINLLMRGCDHRHPFSDIIEDARLWVSKSWQVMLRHRPREFNTIEDSLAKSAHSMQENFVILHNPPSPFHEVVGTEG